MAGSEPNSKASEKQGDKLHDWKPGSDPTEARHLRAPGDFGIPAMEEDSVEGRYVSHNTKMSDPGNAQARAGEDGDRTSGVGANRGGAGAGSSGDVDTDFTGVGSGGSVISESGPDEEMGADEVNSSDADGHLSSETTGEQTTDGDIRVKGSVIDRSGEYPGGDAGQGADSASNPARGDDSFAGEVSSGEATGQDSY